MNIIKRYEELLEKREEISEVKYVNKKRLLHVQIVYNMACLLKAIYTKADCYDLASTILNQMIDNCVLDKSEPRKSDDWQLIPLNKYGEGLEYLYLLDYMEGYLITQIVNREPFIFKNLCNVYLKIKL